MQNHDVYTNEEAANLDDRERYEAVAADDSPLTGDLTKDACVNPGWGNPPPPDHAYPQAYGNQSCIGQIRSTEANDLFNQGFQAAMGERNYQDEQRRSNALALAIQYAQSGKDAAFVVKTAEAFHAFLSGKMFYQGEGDANG